ncbi:hypothetical protein AB3S75_021335 [Citrus x aurantiifolia]
MAQQSSAKEVDPEDVSKVIVFLKEVGASSSIPDDCCTNDSYSNILGRHIKVHKIQRGRLICHLSVKPAILNFFGGIHGGAIAAFSERMAIACARTVVAEDKEIFLGELGISYLSAAPHNAELIMEASVVRSGRNVTVVAVEFKFNNTGKLVCASRATFYNTPIAKL